MTTNLAAARFHPSKAVRHQGCKADLLGEGSWGLVAPFFPTGAFRPSTLDQFHWAFTHVTLSFAMKLDIKHTYHFNRISMWSSLHCSPSWNGVLLQRLRENFLKYPSSHQFIRVSEPMLITLNVLSAYKILTASLYDILLSSTIYLSKDWTFIINFNSPSS